eukprot:5203278-Prymnesium_polylepis.1
MPPACANAHTATSSRRHRRRHARVEASICASAAVCSSLTLVNQFVTIVAAPYARMTPSAKLAAPPPHPNGCGSLCRRTPHEPRAPRCVHSNTQINFEASARVGGV